MFVEAIHLWNKEMLMNIRKLYRYHYLFKYKLSREKKTFFGFKSINKYKFRNNSSSREDFILNCFKIEKKEHLASNKTDMNCASIAKTISRSFSVVVVVSDIYMNWFILISTHQIWINTPEKQSIHLSIEKSLLKRCTILQTDPSINFQSTNKFFVLIYIYIIIFRMLRRNIIYIY